MNREIILAGRPNSGKSTLYNRLATSYQKVANYAGCTVEKKTSLLADLDEEIQITDLPGVYSLQPNTKDEEVALTHLSQTCGQSQVVIVADGNNLEQELALPLLLRKQGHDVVIAVNMMDEVETNKRVLDLAGMTELAGIPFFPISAKTGRGVEGLKKYLVKRAKEPANTGVSELLELKEDFKKARIAAQSIYSKNATAPANDFLQAKTDAIDKWLVHPVIGPFVFLAVMFLVFQSIFAWSAPVSDLVEQAISIMADFVTNNMAPGFLSSLITDGILAGVGSVLVFVPQIAILFFLIGALELSGYLPRASYMVDKALRPYGLEGKVFIPLLSSVACAVPGIMATRTIENERTRILTIMVSPLMTCSARLPVYTLLIGSFIPAQRVAGGLSLQGLTMFALYLLGVVMALAVAWILHKLHFAKQKRGIDFLHLPQYRVPDWRHLFRFVWLRVNAFLRKAGTIIFTMAVLLWFLLSFPKDSAFLSAQSAKLEVLQAQTNLSQSELTAQQAEIENQTSAHNLAYSVAGRTGRSVAPLFAPLGYDWKITIGVLGSLAAREVFVSTLGTVFALGGSDQDTDSLSAALINAKDQNGKPLYTLATCLSLLVFFAFSLQCISTIGVAKRETNSWRIPAFMFVYMFVIAYVSAFAAFQITNLFL